MTPADLTARVMLTTCALAAALALPAGWVGGPAAALGTLAGGTLAALNFRWLAARAVLAATSSAPPAAWLVGTGLRLSACLGACAVLFALGWAHPVGLLVGVTALPCAVVGHGLRAAREEP